MVDPTLTITISQPGADLVLSATEDANDYGIVRYAPPALQARLTAMPDSPYTHGTEYTGMAWQQSLLSFDWVPDHAADEGDVAVAHAAVVAAVGQFEFTVTTQVSGAPAEVWSANAGSVALAGGSRGYFDLVNANPVYSVTIPVYPIAGA